MFHTFLDPLVQQAYLTALVEMLISSFYEFVKMQLFVFRVSRMTGSPCPKTAFCLDITFILLHPNFILGMFGDSSWKLLPDSPLLPYFLNIAHLNAMIWPLT